MTRTTAPVTPDAALPVLRKLTCSARDRDPYPLYAELRAQAPVLRSPLPRALGGYVLSRSAECTAALRDRALVPLGGKHADELVPDWEDHAATHYLYRCLLFQDRSQRASVQRRLRAHFNRSRVRALRKIMESSAEQCLDRLAQREAPGEPVDLVEALTLAYPLAVISELFGLDIAATSELAWAGRTLSCFVEPLQTGPRRERIDQAARDLTEFFGRIIRQCGNEPAFNVVSALTAAWRADELDERELIGNLLFLFTAGYDSSTSFLGNAISALLKHPEQADLVREDTGLAGRAVEELLRYTPPVHAISRVATAPVRIADVDIPAGSPVWLLLASAYRDPARTPAPDRLDVTRRATTNVSFDPGGDAGIGAPLARMEAEVLLPMLLRRFPRLRLAGPSRQRTPGTVLRGPDYLPVLLDV